MSLGNFATYEAAYSFAQNYSDAHRARLYVRAPAPPLEREWTVGFLPKAENCSGWELQVQAVEPTVLP